MSELNTPRPAPRDPAPARPPMSRRRGALAVVIGLWGTAFLGAFWAFHTTAPTGDSFLRGANRIGLFLLWQAGAAALAIPAFVIGRGFPRFSGLWWISKLPGVLALLLFGALAGVILWARLSHP